MSIPTRRLDGLDPTINPQRDHEVAAMRDGISNRLRVEQILALLQSSDIPNAAVTLAKLAADARAAASHTFDDTIAQLGETDVQGAIEAVAARGGKLIGEPFFLFDNITGVSAPGNSGTAKYIRLTAGQSGTGGYNEGLLTNESVSGSAPLVQATAEIATGPLAGQIVPLINTEEAFIRARETSGVLQQDQMQRITGTITSYTGSVRLFRDDGAADGVFQILPSAGSISNAGSTSSGTGFLDFNTANSPNARVSDTTDGETRSKNRSATAYMRIA